MLLVPDLTDLGVGFLGCIQPAVVARASILDGILIVVGIADGACRIIVLEVPELHELECGDEALD